MKKKVFALIAAVAAVLIAVLVLGLSRCVGDYGQIVISLSQKDATVDVADSFQLQLVSDEGVNVDDLQVTWISNKSFIASVNENGTVFGVGAGEAKISAIVQYKDKEYIASCRVTVTPTQEEPSVYRIRYYTQKRDRSGYDIVEDVYESAVGMQINLTDTDISHKLPENYVVNKEKSILSHTVTENKSACVLEVYYDVAKISYTVEAHYESPKKLETYGSTVKQEIEAYAFSPVTLPAPREGFVLNEKAKGSILQDDSIVAGEKLVAYYDRIRSEVKVTFINKPQATYKAVYGIGLVNGKFSDLTDSTELFNVTAYVDNQQVKLTEDYLRKLTADTHISFGVDGQGFYYVADGGVLVNCNYEKTKDSYVYLKGSGSTVYLSATADLTGSGSNIFGITIRSGDQTREVRFQDHGVSVMENHTAEVGTVSGDRDQYTRANWHEDANVYAQNAAGAHYNTYRSSAVNSMVTQRTESSHQIVWTIWEGTLYCSVDGHISLRLPLYHLDPNWTADKTYEIGFSAYDYWNVGDELRFRDICVKFDAEAEKMLVLNNQVKAADFEDMHYQPITGTYLPTIDYGSSYLYLPAITGNGGIRADISWVNKDNSYASPGVTVKVGDVSHYFMVEGMNFWARHFTAVKESIVKMTDTYGHVVRYSKPFDDAGMCKLQAFVKDGKLHILYNGAQAYCIEMKDLFEGYTNKSKVSFGIYCLDGLGGLAHFANVKPVTGQDVQGIDLKDWAFYSENYYTDDLDMAQGKMSQTAQMSEGRFVEVYGEAATWQVEGTMKRTDTVYDQDLPMGLRIRVGDKTATVFGGYNGFAVNEKWNELSQGSNRYAFNNKTTASFFATPRTTDQISFKAVIYKDVLYVWLDGQPCWRLPLTEEYFGGFAAGSKYKIGLAFAGWQGAGETGTMENIQIKSDSQVTGQIGFADTLAKLNANIDRWSELRLGHIYGADAESFTVDYGTWDHAYGYFAPAKGDMGLKVTTGWTDPAAANTWSRVGITLKVGDISHQFVLEEEHSEVKHFTNFTDAVNISSVVKAHVEPFKADKSSDMTAVIKDGKLYLLYNGKQGYCVDMKTLFPGYTADNEVSLGICNLDSQTGIGTFNNIKVLNAKQVADIAVTPWTLWPSDCVLDSADLVAGMIGQNAQMSEGRYIMFSDKNTTWQVEGIMKRTDTLRDQDLPMGLRIQVGDKTATVFGGYSGFAVNEQWNEISAGSNKYAFNNAVTASFFGVPRTTDQISFKAVLHDDVLYVWLDGQLCWRLPLTEDYFGGFAAGSQYQLGLAFAGWQGAGETGAMENIQIKTGSQVTGQNGFANTLATINSNIDRWSELRLGYIYGANVESFTVNYGTWDHAYGYFVPAKGNMGLKVTTGWVDPAAPNTWSRVGITVKVGNTSHQFVLEEEHSEVKHFTNFNGNTQENITGAVTRYVNPFKADKSCDMMAVIKDGKLYLYYNGVQGYMVSMSDLFSGYTADSEVSLGICNLDSQTGIGTFKNIEILSAADVAEKPATGTDVANMNYDPVADAYLPVTQNGPAYLYNQAIVGNQAVSTTITYYNGEISNNGISIKIGNQSVQLVGHGGYDYMRILRNQWESQINEFPHTMTVNNVYSEIKAVINNGKLYMIYNGVQMNPINMTELFPDYQLTDAVQLGIYSHNAPVDWVKFTDTKFYTTAAEVDKIAKFYAANVNSADVNILNGTIVKKGYAQVQLEGVSNIWEVTGTLYNYVPGSYLQPAFEVRDTNGRAVQAMIDGNGIQFPWGDYRGDGPYCINPNTGHFHWWGINEMDFRIVVANDILYAWFETAGDGNLIATWHIPLTEYYNGRAYGGCAAGSQYTFKFLLGGDDAVNGQSGLKNVVVRTGENASTEGIW